jgi:His/Glu/Gln/Arg/opine family amino acid ABC transporter permease subunit
LSKELVDLGVLWRNLGYLVEGAFSTVRLSFVALFVALALGVMSGIARLYARHPVRAFAVAYIELFRATPVLVQMFFIFFGLPMVWGWDISGFTAAAVALSLNSGAYFAEIIRGGIQSIPIGQSMAGFASGMNRTQVLRYIIIPQAIRRIVPPAVGQFTILVKDTSVASIIGFLELTKASQHVIERTFASFEIFTLAGVMYFIVCYSVSGWSKKLESKLASLNGYRGKAS